METNVVCYTRPLINEGYLINKYIPFKNLLASNNKIKNFQTGELIYTKNYPLNIEIQPSYDGSVNLILNDDSNSPKMINSRFSVLEESQFEITDHKGNKDTNLYQEHILDQDTNLYKTINKIPKLTFDGLSTGGNLKVGAYHFYFKLSDNDDNETDFIMESGLVVCHIGELNDPQSIRMGISNENSQKSVMFTVSNLDESYDYIKVYYTRTTSDESGIDVTTAYYIDEKFSINKQTKLVITGFESQYEISLDEINPYFQYCQSVKTQAQCQNMLFFGNIEKPKLDHEFFEKVSLLFKPKAYLERDNIGTLNINYKDFNNKYVYYNVKNLYYKLGYFPTEYYRFGIVYILNDGTLTPVFNIRGGDLSIKTESNPWTLLKNLNCNDEGLVENSIFYENVKGVIKFPNESLEDQNYCIRPLSLKIEFQDEQKINSEVGYWDELKTKIKGYFFVRQNRIPTFYAQGLVIGKTINNYGNIPVIKNKENYVAESFLTKGSVNDYTFEDPKSLQIKKNSGNLLHNNYVKISSQNVRNQAMIVPEVQIRQPIFNSLFTSSEFQIEAYKKLKSTQDSQILNDKHLYLNNKQFIKFDKLTRNLQKLTIVPDSLKITTDGENYFSAMAGEPGEVLQVVDVNYDLTKVNGVGVGKVNKILTNSDSKVRGYFGMYVGTNNNRYDYGTIVNIRPSDYNPEDKQYNINQYVLRSNINEPYYAISDRLETALFNSDINKNKEFGDFQEIGNFYRGDCFINQVTHRLHRNFIDDDLPLNDDIVDVLTWHNNYAVVQKSEQVDLNGVVYVSNKPSVSFYRKWSMNENNGLVADQNTFKETTSQISSFLDDLTGDTTWENFGSVKINKGDLNAVPIGTWITFTCLSNVNLAMRDIDMSIPGEASLFNKPRGFYPLQPMSKYSSNKQPESSVMNGAINVTLSKRHNFLQPDVPWIKNRFDTRIMYSDIAITDAFKNGYRVFQGTSYRDYPKTYGSIVCLKELNGDLIAVMEHGILRIPVNERAVAAQGSGGNVYINTSNVLPENPLVLSDSLGSLWQDSVIKTVGLEGYTLIYGVDTVAKKIWMTDGQQVKIISDFKVQKFLNDNINFITTDKQEIVGEKNCKSHYNAFKRDVLFTFYNTIRSNTEKDENGEYKIISQKEWNLCYNEVLQKFITFYSWTPSFSANIDNIYFSFDKNQSDSYCYLWKHGQAGNFENQDKIKPTHWYGKQHTFEFEFVVNQPTIVQKIFDNLKIISNKAEPKEFVYEIVGETYDWFKYKDIITWINNRVQDPIENQEFKTLEEGYKFVLLNKLSNIKQRLVNGKYIYQDFPIGDFDLSTQFKKLPFIKRIRRPLKGDKKADKWEANSTEVTLIEDTQLNEDRISTKQYGNDIKKVGRIKGNMQYLEDLWDIEIRPTNFKYAYLDNNKNLQFKSLKQERIRDKYLKIRIIYSGEDLAIIQGLKTLYTISYS